MPDIQESQTLTRVSPLLPGDGENIINYTNLQLRERRDLAVIQILSFANKQQAAAKSIGKALGIDCPTSPGTCLQDDNTQVAWNGPNSWMIISDCVLAGRNPDDLVDMLKQALGDSAAVVDQSHGRCILRLSGLQAQAVMLKNCALDLHQSHFQAGQCALTPVAHMNALIIQVNDTDYDLVVARSLARSFAHSIEHACHEFADS